GGGYRRGVPRGPWSPLDLPLEIVAELCQRRPEDARDVDLAHADLLCDLRLGHAQVEAEVDDAAVPLRQPLQRAQDGHALRGVDEGLVLLARHPDLAAALGPVVADRAGIEARGAVGGPGL